MDRIGERNFEGLINEEAFYTPREIGELFNVSPYTVRNWIKTGKLKGYRIGGRFKVSGKDLLDFLYKSRI